MYPKKLNIIVSNIDFHIACSAGVFHVERKLLVLACDQVDLPPFYLRKKRGQGGVGVEGGKETRGKAVKTRNTLSLVVFY